LQQLHGQTSPDKSMVEEYFSLLKLIQAQTPDANVRQKSSELWQGNTKKIAGLTT
jgi:hypothetical protein